MPIDYSPLLGPVPESGAAKGQRFFADALDAVLQRRQQRQLQEQQMAFQARENQAQRDLMGGYYNDLTEGAAASREEAARTNKAQEGINQFRAQLEYNRAKAEALKQGREAAESDAPDVAAAYENMFTGLTPPWQQQQQAPAPAAPAPAPAAPRGPVITTPQPQGPGVVPPAFPHMDAPLYTGHPSMQPPPAPVPPALLPDPAAAVATQQRPSINWQNLTPGAQADKFRDRFANVPLSDPRLRHMVTEGEAAIASRTLKPEVGYEKTLGAERDRISREKSAALAARGAGERHKGTMDVRLTTAADSLLNSITRRTDYVKENEKFKDIQGQLKDLESDNPAQQRAALGVWAKQKSGPGAVQLAERNEFVNVIGGKDEAIRKMLGEWLDDGKIPPGQLKFFVDAVRRFELPRQTKRMERIHGTVRNAFRKHPNPGLRDFEDWAVDQIDSLPAGAPSDAEIDDLVNSVPDEAFR